MWKGPASEPIHVSLLLLHNDLLQSTCQTRWPAYFHITGHKQAIFDLSKLSADEFSTLEDIFDSVLDSSVDFSNLCFHPPEKLENLYKFKNLPEINSLLESKPHLSAKLREAYTHIKNAFEDAELHVQVQKEWEGPILWIFVYGSWTVEEAEQRLQKFNDAWGLKTWSETEGTFNVDVRWK